MKFILYCIFFCSAIPLWAQPEIELYNEAAKMVNGVEKIAKLDEAIKTNSKFWQGYYLRASTHFALDKWELAAQDYQNTIQYMPSDDKSLKENVYYNMALAYGKQQKWREAGSSIKVAYEIDTASHNTLKLAAWIMEGLGDKNRAINFYRKAINNSSDDRDKKLNVLANILRIYADSPDKKEELLAVCNEILGLDFNNFNARYYRAQSYLNKKQYEFARQDLILLEPAAKEAAIKLEIIFNRAVCLWELKNYDEAIKDFSKVIDMDSKYTNAYINRASLYFNKRMFEEAEKDLKKALDLDPKNDNTRLAWIELMTQNGGFKQALEELTAFSKQAPNNAKIWYNIGVNRMSLNREERVRSDFEKAIQIDPQYAEAWHRLGLVIGRNEDSLNIAEKHVQKAISLKPDYWEAYGSLGEIKARKGELLEGLKLCNMAVDKEKTASNYISLCEVQNIIGDYYLKKPDSSSLSRNYYTQALSSSEQAIAQDKFTGNAYYVRANSRMRLLEKTEKPTKEVLDDIEQAEKLLPSNAYVLYVHALYLIAVGNDQSLREAANLMDKALDRKPNFYDCCKLQIITCDKLIEKGFDMKSYRDKADGLLGKKG